MAVSQAPPPAWLKRVAFMLNPRGTPTLRECICPGAPIRAFPLGLDQHGSAARVVSPGIGIEGPIKKISAAYLSKFILRMESHAGSPKAEAVQKSLIRSEKKSAGCCLHRGWGSPPRLATARLVLPWLMHTEGELEAAVMIA